MALSEIADQKQKARPNNPGDHLSREIYHKPSEIRGTATNPARDWYQFENLIFDIRTFPVSSGS